MLSDLLTWWATEMLGWVPVRFTASDPVPAQALIVRPVEAPGGQTIEVTLRRKRRDQRLGQFDLDAVGPRALRQALPARPPRGVVLRLPSTLLLDREVVLPLAAEREPERVLTYEMDRLTPFACSEIFWTYTIEQRDRARGRLHLRLSLVTKVAIQTLLDSLTRAGLAPTLLEVATPGGDARHIALQRPDTRRERLGRRLTIAVGAVCAGLAVATIALPFVMQSIADHRIEKRIGRLRPMVTEAETLRHRIATNNAGTDVLETERLRAGDALTVLATLTTLLPDDTYLTDFAMRQGKLMINGQSGAAVRLIAALSGDPVIRAPAFAAPVTRFDNRADLFSIRAEVSR